MIHMLSRFNLKPDADLKTFEKHYISFFLSIFGQLDWLKQLGKLGERVGDTPMDTDSIDAQQYYVVMEFRDRDQLDGAYYYMENGSVVPEFFEAHEQIKKTVENPVFTCWQDGE